MDQIGTIPLKSLVSSLRAGVIIETSTYHPSPQKWETSDFSGMVPIWFLIYIKWPLKWALDESSPIKLMFPFPFPYILARLGMGLGTSVLSESFHLGLILKVILCRLRIK